MIGKKLWVIPDMYWPEGGTAGNYISHEAICVLNTGEQDAKIEITLYFEDREPVTGIHVLCSARRTNHIRMDKLAAAPKGVGYAAVVESDVPVIVQYTRVDTTQPELALMTTVAY